ncbi:MAG: Type II secretion system protein G precursor [bacterium ADurb.Bin157]|nr:MAG: Type II secretion system protein G precursor [bacterium ADurb.Bin157]
MKNRKGFTLIELMIVIAIIGILAAMAIPNFKKAREQAREKACYSNIRVLLGAVEMYNMDHSVPLETPDQSKLTGANGYLKSSVECPESGGKYEGSNLSKDGLLSCSIHGTVDGSVAGK